MNHLYQQIKGDVIHVNTHLLQVLNGIYFPLRETDLKFWKVGNALPGLFGRGAHDFEDFEDLSDF
jgi:hypothetical protein